MMRFGKSSRGGTAAAIAPTSSSAAGRTPLRGLRSEDGDCDLLRSQRVLDIGGEGGGGAYDMEKQQQQQQQPPLSALVVDRLLVEMDVSHEEDDESAENSELDDWRQYWGKRVDDEDIEGTEALSYCMASGLELSASDSLDFRGGGGGASPQGAASSPSKSRLRLPHGIAKALQQQHRQSSLHANASNESPRSPRRWSIKMDPRKGRRFQTVEEAEDTEGLIKFPTLENDEGHLETAMHGIVDNKPMVETDREQTTEQEEEPFAYPVSPCKESFLHPAPLPVPPQDVTKKDIVVVPPPSVEFSCPPPPRGRKNHDEELRIATDIVLDGFVETNRNTADNGRRDSMPGLDSNDGFASSPTAASQDDMGDEGPADSVPSSPTKMRNALHRLGRLKKKMTQKLTTVSKPTELSHADLDTQEESQAQPTTANTHWTGKIAELATHSARLAAQSVPRSPVKARRGHERLDSCDASDFLSVSAAQTEHLPLELLRSLDSCPTDLSVVDVGTCASETMDSAEKSPSMAMSNTADDSADDDDDCHAHTHVDALCESNAPDGTVWVNSGGVRHLEISF